MMDALRRSRQAAAGIAAMAVLVDAKDDAAKAFYRHFGFLPVQAQPRRVFLPMKIVVGLFDENRASPAKRVQAISSWRPLGSRGRICPLQQSPKPAIACPRCPWALTPRL